MSTSSVLLSPKGRDFVRVAIARAAAGSAALESDGLAEARWGAYSRPAVAMKAAISPITDSEVHGVARDVAREFFGVVKQGSIVGRLSGLVEVPFDVRTLAMTGGVRGYWVAQSAPAPLSKPTLMGSTLRPLTVRAIIVATKESLEPGDLNEARLHADLQRACAEVIDLAFIDPANAGITDEMPASVTQGTAVSASSGDAAADVEALIRGFSGDLTAAHFVTDPITASQMALWRGTNGGYAFPDMGPRGGYILGVPIVVSRSSPRDSSGGLLALVDPSGIAIGLGGVDLSVAEQASLMMADDPATGPAELVSLWQNNLVAFSALIRANWEVQRTGAVVTITGASY